MKRKGIKAAITSAGQSYEITYPGKLEMERRFGFNVGGFIEWFDHPWFSLMTRAKYAQRGMGMEFSITAPDGPDLYQLHRRCPP